MHRKHLRVLYERNPTDLKKNLSAVSAVHEAAVEKFGSERIRRAKKPGKDEGIVFPVMERDGRIASSIAVSDVLTRLPVVAYDYVLVLPEIRSEAEEWLRKNRDDILEEETTEGEEE